MELFCIRKPCVWIDVLVVLFWLGLTSCVSRAHSSDTTKSEIPSFQSSFPNLPIGAAIKYSYLNPSEPHYALLRHFGALVFENDMKQESIQPVEGYFNFKRADDLVAYAEQNGKKLRGHTLVWHNQVPAWFFQSSSDKSKPATKEELLSRMETHIRTLVGRYKGKIDSWDVVNEVVDDSGKLRDSKYLQIVGSEEYIADAFRWAHETDPDAELFINDYNLEYKGPKQNYMYDLVKRLLEQGVPINGVGLQCHITIMRPRVDEIRGAIERFASLGLKVQVTELDMSVYTSSSEKKKIPDQGILMKQATRYKDLFTMFEQEAEAGRLDMVMFWGVADDGTWLNNFPVYGRADYPLLFGKDFKPKPAFWAIVDPSHLSE